MHLDREALRAQAGWYGLVLSDDDLAAIEAILKKTRAAMAGVAAPEREWGDPPIGFLPPHARSAANAAE
jgi:hypothetical protein